MLQVSESVVLIFEVRVHVDYVSQRGGIKLLHWDTSLHYWPLVIKEKFKLVFVFLIVLCHTEGKAQTWFVLVPAVAWLTDILVDCLLRFECSKAKESDSVKQIVKIEFCCLVLVHCISEERYDLDVYSLTKVKELFLELVSQVNTALSFDHYFLFLIICLRF